MAHAKVVLGAFAAGLVAGWMLRGSGGRKDKTSLLAGPGGSSNGASTASRIEDLGWLPVTVGASAQSDMKLQ